MSIRGTGHTPTPDALFNTCAIWDVEIRFHGGAAMHFMSDDRAEPFVRKYRNNFQQDGTTFFGTQGRVSLSRSSYAASNPDWLRLNPCNGDRRVPYRNHYYEAFVESVRDRRPSVAPIDDAILSDAIVAPGHPDRRRSDVGSAGVPDYVTRNAGGTDVVPRARRLEADLNLPRLRPTPRPPSTSSASASGHAD